MIMCTIGTIYDPSFTVLQLTRRTINAMPTPCLFQKWILYGQLYSTTDTNEINLLIPPS